MGAKLSISMNSTVEGGGGLFPTLMGPLTMPGSEQTSALTPKGSGGSSVEWLDRVRPLYVLNKKEGC